MKDAKNDRQAYGDILRAAAESKDKDARWEAARRHVRAGSVPPDDPTAYDPERAERVCDYCGGRASACAALGHRRPEDWGIKWQTGPAKTEHASAAYELGAGNPQQAQFLHDQFHADHRIHRIAGPVIPPHRSKSERVVDAVLVFLIVALVTAAALHAAGVLTQ